MIDTTSVFSTPISIDREVVTLSIRHSSEDLSWSNTRLRDCCSTPSCWNHSDRERRYALLLYRTGDESDDERPDDCSVCRRSTTCRAGHATATALSRRTRRSTTGQRGRERGREPASEAGVLAWQLGSDRHWSIRCRSAGLTRLRPVPPSAAEWSARRSRTGPISSRPRRSGSQVRPTGSSSGAARA